MKEIVLGVIPARGGSKRVHKKNIKLLGKKPLIAWTIEAAKKARTLDYFLVSTDDDEIAKISKHYGAHIPFKRSAALSIDCDSIPGYSPLLVRYDGTGVLDVLPFDDLWAKIGTTEHTNDKRSWKSVFSVNVFVGQTSKSGSVFTEIKNISRHNYAGNLVRVNTTCGLLDATPNHSLIGSAGQVIDAAKIEIGDTLAQPPLVVHGYPECDEFIGGVDLAWLTGFFVAEGSLATAKKKTSTSYMIQISNKDIFRLKKAAKIMRKYFHRNTFITTRPDCSSLGSSSIKAYRYFSHCYTLNHDKKVPKLILNAKKQIKQAFLDGYNEGDGVTKEQKKWHSGRYKCFGSVSQTLCMGLLLLVTQTTKQEYSVGCRPDKLNFTRLVLNESIRKRRDDPQRVKYIQEVPYKGYVYDVETKSHQFCSGIGTIRAHNSCLVLQDAVLRYESYLERGRWDTPIVEGDTKVSYVVCLQPTSPLRQASDIDECVRIAKATGAESVVSFRQAVEHPFWLFQTKPYGHEMEPFMGDVSLEGDNLVIQNLPVFFYPNGAVYVTRRDVLMKGRIYGSTQVYGYMMPSERSIDLEEELDFKVAEALIPMLAKDEPLVKTSWVTS